MKRLGLALLALATAVACGAAPEDEAEETTLGETAQAATTPEMSVAEIVALAESGVGYSYWWGGGRWDPSSKQYPGACSGSCPSCSHWASPSGGPEYGADCSGYVSQVWQVPTRAAPTVNRHPYTTYNFRNQETHWYRINRSELQKGDALVYNTNGAGHIMLFDKWSGGGNAVVYECAGCSIGCVHRSRSVGSAYIAIRRRGLTNAAPETPPENPENPPENPPTENPPDTKNNKKPDGFLDAVGCDGLGGWAQDNDSKSAPVDIVLSFGGPLNNKNAVKVTVNAGQHREDLCSAIGSCKHGFTAAIPQSLKDGKTRSVYAYAVDEQTGEHKLLVGAPRNFKCGAGSSNASGSCGHGECETGGPLATACSPCANAVCAYKPECCAADGSWDASCVEKAGDIPGACQGVCADGVSSCAHSECAEGDKLPEGCSTCAGSVCERDPYCCSHKWDWICVSEATKDPFCSCGGQQ